MPSQLIGALIAVGLGYWAYTDAKALERRGIRVGSFPPVAWGFGVALVAILFGILYLRQRGRAVRFANSSPGGPGNAQWAPPPPPPPSIPAPEGTTAPAPGERNRFCGSCGHELPTYVASFCPKCGRAL